MKHSSSNLFSPSSLLLALVVLSSVILSSYATPSPALELEKREDKQYIIYPKTGADEDKKKKITEALQKDLGKDKVFTSTDGGIGLWIAPLSSKQLEDYKKKDGIQLIVEEGPAVGWGGGEDEASSHQKRKEVKQPNSRPEMKFIAQPEDIETIKDTPDYQYDDSAGEGITIYIINSGANVEHPVSSFLIPLVPSETQSNLNTNACQEFSDIKNKKFMFADSLDREKTDSVPGKGHGTCVMAKAGGKKYGVAKKADFMQVKVGKENTFGKLQHAFRMVLNDVKMQKLQGKAVINYSGVKHVVTNQDQKKILADTILKPLFDLDIVLVAASGNQAKETKDITSWPQSEADDFPIINVGSVDVEGKTAETSQGGKLLTVSAPGKEIMCADSTGNLESLRSGTSYGRFAGYLQQIAYIRGAVATLVFSPLLSHNHVNHVNHTSLSSCVSLSTSVFSPPFPLPDNLTVPALPLFI